MKKYPQFTSAHDTFRKAVRHYCENELAPHAVEWEKNRYFPDSLFKDMGERGFFRARYSKDGMTLDGDIWNTVVFAEELPRCEMGGLVQAMLIQSDIASPIIAKHGTDQQKREFLIPAIDGQKIVALAIAEPESGSDMAAMNTLAMENGGDFILNGSKTWITNGARADFVIVAARTDADNLHGGITLFLVPSDTQGFRVGNSLEKIGLRCSDTTKLFFENCRIPRDYTLGEEGHGYYYLMDNLQGERLVSAISGVATAQLVLNNTIEYSRERHAFGRPLSGFQVTRHKIVDMETQLEACRTLSYHAADLFDRDIPCQREISMAKLMVGEVAMQVVDQCVQIHGASGYAEQGFIARAWRDTRAISLDGGTTEIMKELIAKLMGF